ncbi:MAG: ATP-binding cassette domain-containing protein [Ignavibacteria bacterium]|jgi:ABC-2 type transport system ATP-binding protein|nr:ATP-binding cassette domain-containing protein [Ignavibacteria bacterium]
MISIQNLNFKYNRKNSVFSDITLNIAQGNIYGLLGENGVGKTTLLRLISGLLFPDSGTCHTFGADAKKRIPSMLQKIYYLPEEISIPPTKVWDYGKIYGQMYPNFSNQQFAQYLTLFNIDAEKKMSQPPTDSRKKQ